MKYTLRRHVQHYLIAYLAFYDYTKFMKIKKVQRFPSLRTWKATDFRFYGTKPDTSWRCWM